MEVKWWYVLVASLLIIAVATLAVRGYTHTARFPHDWQYYVDVNIPSYSTDHPVVRLTLPTQQWVAEGKLRPDCSDLRFTTTDSITAPLKYHIATNLYGFAFGVSSGSTATAHTLRFSTDYDGNLYLAFDVIAYDHFNFVFTDLNTGHSVSGGYYNDQSYGVPLVFRLEAGHVYELNTSGTRQRSSRLTSPVPWFQISGDAVYLAYAAFVPDPMPPDYCRDHNAVVYVQIPQGAQALRVWFGAVGDVDSASVPMRELARETTASIPGAGNFSSCSSWRYCGADTACSGGDSGSWGLVQYSRSFSGRGDEYYRGTQCHNKRWHWYDFHSCGYAFTGNTLASSYLDDPGSGCCTAAVSDGGSVTFTLPTSYPYLEVYADTLSYSYPYYMTVSITAARLYRGSSYTLSGFYFGCLDGQCYARVPVSLEKGPYNRYSHSFASYGYYPLEFALPSNRFSASVRHYSFYDVCGSLFASITWSNPRQYYLTSSDIIDVTVPASTTVSEYSVPPTIVFSGPTSVYWGVPVTYSLDGNFVRSEFNIEPFGLLQGPSVTVEWNDPGVYHITAVAYNEYNTPSWYETDVNVIPRTLSLSAEPEQTPYFTEPFSVTLTVTDNIGDPVPSVILSSDYCQTCNTSEDGTCTTTCTIPPAITAVDFNAIPADTNHYTPAILTATFDMHRFETDFVDIAPEVYEENGTPVAFRITGRLMDTHNDKGISDQPLIVKVTTGNCDENTVGVPVFNGVVYSMADGIFRIYIYSAEPGRYCLSIFYPGCDVYAPAGPKEFALTYSPPSQQVSAPSEEQNTIVVSTSAVAPTVTVATPVSITPLSAAPLNISTTTAVAGIGAIAIVAVLIFLLR